MADWVVANLDVSPQTARRMMRIARADHRDIEQRMAAGEFGIDRAAFLCQISDLGGAEELIADSDRYSLGHLCGVIDRLRKIDSLTEQMMFEDRYMALQPSLDRSSGRFWGQTHGTDWHIIEKALTHRESQLPALEDQTQGQRRVDALASLCMDSLTTTGDGSDTGRAVTVAEVFVDAALAAPSFGGGGHAVLGAPGLDRTPSPRFCAPARHGSLFAEKTDDRSVYPTSERRSRPPPDRRLPESLSDPTPPHQATSLGRRSRSGQSGESVLVPPSCRHPSDGYDVQPDEPATSKATHRALPTWPAPPRVRPLRFGCLRTVRSRQPTQLSLSTSQTIP